MTDPLRFDELDDPQLLLETLGSFWARFYAGSDNVGQILYARGRLTAQAELSFYELLASMSRLTVPVFHTDNWFALTLKESERNNTTAALARFDETDETFREGGLRYGIAGTEIFTWPAPAGLHSVKCLFNRLAAASLSWISGVDFVVNPDEPPAISFRRDPFLDERVPKRDIVDADTGAVSDRECLLWLYRGQFDLDLIYRQFGYALGLKLRSSAVYRELVNAVFDALISGGTADDTDRVLAAAAGVPLVETAGEIVEDIFVDDRALWVITDKQAYRHGRRANAAVEIGAVLSVGQSLTDALRISEFGDGATPADVPALALGRGFLGAGYYQDLVFENKVVPLQVTQDVDGWTRVEFAIGGLPADVAKFWDQVHLKGRLAGKTLAMLLDQRPAAAQDNAPTAMALPATINPLGFLAGNVLRNHIWLARLRPRSFGADALGLAALPLLRRIKPVHSACIVLVELAIDDPAVILDGPGDESSAGYVERFDHFLGNAGGDAVDGAALIVERVRARTAPVYCK